MDEGYWRHIRERAIHLLRSGRTVREMAQILQHSESWVYKCWQRYQEAGWEGLKSGSRRPRQRPRNPILHDVLAVPSAVKVPESLHDVLAYDSYALRITYHASRTPSQDAPAAPTPP